MSKENRHFQPEYLAQKTWEWLKAVAVGMIGLVKQPFTKPRR